MACTYILFSDNAKKFYIGSSHDDNPETRLHRHNSGVIRSTKAYRPWRLIAVERFDSYTEARKRELFLKTGVGREWIKMQFGHLKSKFQP